MPITLHAISIDVSTKAIITLKSILLKAKAHSPAESAPYPSARLYEDMYTLANQVTNASDIVKTTVYRLAPSKGPEPTWENNESTMDELIARVTPEEINGQEDVQRDSRLRNGTVVRGDVKGLTLGMGVPNVMFHVSIAYGILRMKGVPLGKVDFLAPFMQGLEVVRAEGS